MASLGMLVPTRGRPENAIRLTEAFNGTATLLTSRLIFVVDYDDPRKQDYLDLVPLGAEVHLAPEYMPKVRGMGPVLNYAAGKQWDNFSHLGFMGDDHIPRTTGWDEILCRELEGKPGVAYGNDLHQRGNLPTAAVISSFIVRTLGYMSAPNLEHLYIDNFWLELGKATHLAYRDDIIIEHLHPDAGKAQRDEGYAMSTSYEQANADAGRFQEFMTRSWPNDLARLTAILEGAR